MTHEVNITKSYKNKKGKEKFYNTPSKDVPDMSLPSEYGKQYDNLEDAVKEQNLFLIIAESLKQENLN
jgi:hypothetical protein